jgi:TM2 domain-containing membrane protein YozV
MKMTKMVYCRGCAAEIHESAPNCPKCGAAQGIDKSVLSGTNNESAVLLLVVCILVGWLGVHRFMVGKIGTGVLMLLTLGGWFIWWIIDIIYIATGNFTDKKGKKIKF